MNDTRPHQIRIHEAGLVHARPLNRLFVDAVRSHFTYFPPAIRDRVIADHNVLRLAKAIIDPRRVVLVARQGRRLVGYAIGAVPAGGVGQFFWLYVEPAFRGQNTGLSLLSRMVKAQRAKGAKTVVLSTHDHRPYYERQGFVFLDNDTVDGVSMAIMEFRLEDGR